METRGPRTNDDLNAEAHDTNEEERLRLRCFPQPRISKERVCDKKEDDGRGRFSAMWMKRVLTGYGREGRREG